MSIFDRKWPLPGEDPDEAHAATPEFSPADRRRAGWQSETVRTDAWMYSQRLGSKVTSEVFTRLPEDTRREIYDGHIARNMGDEAGARARILAEAKRQAELDPEGWAGIPLTEDDFQAEITRRRAASLEEAEQVLGLDGGGLAGFLGTAARAMTDETSVALAPLGVAAASPWKFIASEAALGALGEAAVLPKEFAVAEDLDTEDPNVAARLALGAAGGAAFAGVLTAAQRAARYARGRKAAHSAGKPDHVDPQDHDDAVRAAEEEMRDGRKPLPRPAPAPAVAPSGLTETVGRIIDIESAGNPNAKNPSSSAAGLGQFIDSTWMATIKKYRPDLVAGRSRAEILQLKFDPALAREMTTRLTEENLTYLQSRGLPHGPGELYIAHFAGRGGAAKVLSAPMNAPISSVMTKAQIAANRGIRHRGKSFAQFTVGDMRAWAAAKMGAATPITEVPEFAGYTSRAYTASGQVTAGDGNQIDVAYEVVDAALLRPAEGRFQPRDRSRAQSDEQIAEIAARLDPARLLPSPEADRGAPVVGPDNMVESGNGRVQGILRAAERHPDRFGAYRAAIEAAGYEIPEGVQTPVLIARRKTAFDDAARERFVRDANTSAIARMSATERAQVSAREMGEDVIALFDPDQPLTARDNRAFVTRALKSLPQTERNALSDASGQLNAEGVRTLKEIMFARAYDAPDILARYAETDAGELRSLMEALERAAPAWAAMRADVAAGLVRAEMDITPHVLDAMRLIASAREIAAREGGSVSKVLDQLLDDVDMLEGAVAPLTVAMVRKMWRGKRAASADDIADFLTRYAAEARKVGTTDGGLFGDAPGALDVLKAIDADTFGDLTETGTARGSSAGAEPQPQPEPAPLPETGFDRGAVSPEAELADARAIEDLTAPVDTAAARDELAAFADLEFSGPDGVTVRVGELIDDLEADQALDDVLASCNIGGAR